MTPPGVEHMIFDSVGYETSEVIETMTPPGVEHTKLVARLAMMTIVIETMTPPGVEHIKGLLAYLSAIW